MKRRWAPAFTIVEIVIVILVLSVLAIVSVVGYNSIQKAVATRVIQSDLNRVDAQMQREYLKTGSYPASLPSDFQPSKNSTVVIASSGETPYYTNLSPVQNGVLVSQICENLIEQGVGQGVDQGGTTRNYITGCGNWNHGSMQVTGWSTKVWSAPVSKEQLVNYATTYTVSDSYHKAAQEQAVKTFYQQLIAQHENQGGTFPINSFWDYWATPTNGGVQLQPLTPNPQVKPYYCAQAQSANYETIIWHVTNEGKMRAGEC